MQKESVVTERDTTGKSATTHLHKPESDTDCGEKKSASPSGHFVNREGVLSTILIYRSEVEVTEMGV